MKRRLCFLIVFVLLSVAHLQAQTTISLSSFSSPQTWTLANSPYTITTTCTFTSSLTIEAGVEIRFAANAGLNFDSGGSLVARGNPSSMIKFLSSTGAYWRGINFLATAVPTTMDDATFTYISGSIIEYATFTSGSSFIVANSRILVRNCVFSVFNGFAIQADYELRVINNTFTNGAAAINGVLGNNPTGVYKHYVINNTIQQMSDYRGGITITNWGLVTLSLISQSFVVVTDNKIELVPRGIYIHASMSYCNLSRNTLSGAIDRSYFWCEALSNSPTPTVYADNTFINPRTNSEVALSIYGYGSTIQFTRNRFIGWRGQVLLLTAVFNIEIVGNEFINCIGNTLELVNSYFPSSTSSLVRLLETYACSTRVVMTNNTFYNNTFVKDHIFEYTSTASSGSANCNNVIAFNNFTDNTFVGSPSVQAAIVGITGRSGTAFRRNILNNPRTPYELAIKHGSDVQSVDTTLNYWGTASIIDLRNRILDFFLKPTVGIAMYSPLLLESRYDASPYTDPNSGIILTNTVLSTANSPYFFPKTIIVESGVTLTVEAGVSMTLSNMQSILVRGKLIIQGNTTHPVTIKCETDSCYWASITFVSTATPTTVTAQNEYSSGSLLKNVQLMNGGNGALASIVSGVSLMLDNVAIRNSASGAVSTTTGLYVRSSNICDNMGHAIQVTTSTANTMVLVQDSIVCNNQGDGIRVTASSSSITTSILNNQLTNNTFGATIIAKLNSFKFNYNRVTSNSKGSLLASITLTSSNAVGEVLRNNFSSAYNGCNDHSVTIESLLLGTVTVADNSFLDLTSFNSNSGVTISSPCCDCKMYIQRNNFTNISTSSSATRAAITIQGYPNHPETCNTLFYIPFMNNRISSTSVTSSAVIISVTNYNFQFAENLFIGNTAQYLFGYNTRVDLPSINVAKNYWTVASFSDLQALILDHLVNPSLSYVEVTDRYTSEQMTSLATSSLLPNHYYSDLSIPSGIYTITGTIIIQPGACLLIAAGSTIQMSNNASILVKGCIKATGTASNPIRFVPQSSSFGMITIAPTSIPSQVTANTTDAVYLSGSYMQNVIFDKGGNGAPATLHVQSPLMLLDNIQIFNSLSNGLYLSRGSMIVRNASIERATLNGIWFSNSTFGNAVVGIYNSNFKSMLGAAVYAECTNAFMTLNISNNTFSSNFYPLTVLGAYNTVAIDGNLFFGHARNISLKPSVQRSSISFSGNIIRDSTTSTAIQFDSPAFANFTISRNQFINLITTSSFTFRFSACYSNVTFSENSFINNAATAQVLVHVESIAIVDWLVACSVNCYITNNNFSSNTIGVTTSSATLQVNGLATVVRNNYFNNPSAPKEMRAILPPGIPRVVVDASFNSWTRQTGSQVKARLADHILSTDFMKLNYVPYYVCNVSCGHDNKFPAMVTENLNYDFCDSGYKGDTCLEFDCSPQGNCYGNGNCTSPFTCTCLPGYLLPNCRFAECSSRNNCSGNGFCYSPGVCTCNAGFTGTNCEIPICFGAPASQVGVCSGKGTCTAPNTCTCTTGYYGTQCQDFQCFGIYKSHASVCNNGNGTCVAPNQCSCVANYYGQDCSLFNCSGIANTSPTVCGGHGQCIIPNTCSCNPVQTIQRTAFELQETYSGTFCESVSIVKFLKQNGYSGGDFMLEADNYVVQTDIIIHANSSLLIAPGSTLQFMNNTGMIVYGLLIAQGNETHSISFVPHSNPTGKDLWKGLRFASTSHYSTRLASNNSTVSKSIIEQCVVSGAGAESSTIAAIEVNEFSVQLKNSKIANTSKSGVLLNNVILDRDTFPTNIQYVNVDSTEMLYKCQ